MSNLDHYAPEDEVPDDWRPADTRRWSRAELLAEIDGLNLEIDALNVERKRAVEALRELAEIHHRTLAPSKRHEPHNRDWTECECKSCRLAQPFAK